MVDNNANHGMRLITTKIAAACNNVKLSYKKIGQSVSVKVWGKNA